MYWLQDPGHGWLVVSREWVDRTCGDKISECSYASTFRDLAYLEEDVDAAVFIEAAGVDASQAPVRYINDFENYYKRHSLVQYADMKGVKV